MTPKPVLKSKTIWTNALIVGLGIFLAFKPEVYESLQPFLTTTLGIDADQSNSINGISLLVIALVNIWLRFKTNSPLEITKFNEEPLLERQTKN